MPFGFKKPSRSYAAEANVYYDPFSGYPTPYDPHTRPSANSGGTNGVGYGGTRNTGRSGGETDSTSTASSRAVRNKKKPVHHVHYAEEPTNTPSKLMRPRSSASVGRAKTRLGVNKGKGNQTRQQDVGAAMATFSALDLAPLPPKSKRNVMAEELQRSDEEQRSAEEVDDVGDRYSGSTSNGARYALGGGNDPPHAGFSSGDVSETEAEAESELSEGEDEEAKGEINARDREHDDSDHRVETIRASLAGAPTGEQPHPTQPLDQIHNEAHYHADFVRPSLRIEQYNSHGQLTPPMSDPGATAAARLTGHSTPQGTVSQAEATSYDAASPWSVYATAPSAAPASFSLTVGQSSRPGSRSSMRSSHRGKNQVSRKYALSPPLSPLGGQGSLVAAAISGNRLYGNADEGESSIRTERHRHEVETEEDGETETQGPSTPVPNAMLAPPTFALQPPTPQHDITHTPFHDVGGRRLSRDAEGDSNLDQRAPTSGYQLPNGLTLDALTHTSAPPAMGPFDGVLERPGPVSSSSRTSSHSTKSSLTSAQAVSTRQGGAPSLHNPTSASLAHNSRSASPTPPQSAVESTTSSGGPPPPAPLNPNQPAFLKWDTSNQRWIPVPTLASNTMPPPQQLQPKRPESVMSSVSAYSQISAPKSVAPPPMSSSSAAGFGMTPANQARRQSLPTLALSPSKSIRGAPSPVMSSRSRPASPSMAPILAPPITGPGSVNGFSAGRRMSIDPPYLMNPNILTLLPEMYEADLGPAETPLSSRSAPHSRTPSIDGRASAAGGRYNGYRASFSSYRPRNSTAFPMGYDVNARAVEMSKANSGSRASSVYGDYASDGEHRWQETYGTSRATSVHEDDVPYEESEYEAESRMGGGAFVGAPPRSVDDGQRKDSVKPGRESALDVMSVRGDSVQMHGLDGTDQPPSGYSSLVLPTGAYVPSHPSKDTDRLNHRLLGMPHSTMSTITISDSSVPSGRRSSLGGLIHHREAPTPAHLLADLPAPVTFSAHQAPPSKISAAQVLVQVHAVALDRFDSDMVREKATSGSGAGKWIPGRSFVGRALDVGADVRVIMKGDMVMGLLDIRKSGCLAEYIVCDRRRLARIPLGVNLSLEEVSCLPLLGVTAHRACIGQTRGSRALILNAHEGVGALAAQELSSLGLYVIAHVPLDVPNAEDDAWDNGAKEVIADDAIAVINAQHESGFEFVLDTIGGRKIYDACRRVLRSNGVFVTMYGDDTEHVPSGPQVKSSLHALRRAFVKKDKKAISYVHLLPGGAEIDVSGQDTRDILELPVMALYRPKVSMVVPFERAPEAFEELATLVSGKPREDPGAVVVRLSN